MVKIINNIGQLKSDLTDKGWHMTAFTFRYNGIEYDVLFENNDDFEERLNPLASVKLTFIDGKDIHRSYSVEANQIRMFFDPREFRDYFGIQYTENLGDVFKQFFSFFLSFVPNEVPIHLNERQNARIDMCLAGRGGHNPDAIYCYDARRLGKRNGKQMHRSIFISNLARRRNPVLYKYFIDEPMVTFYFSPNPYDALSDNEIIHKFSLREEKE